jgi:hypothetical protein
MLTGIMMSIIMQSIIMLSVVMMNVVAPVLNNLSFTTQAFEQTIKNCSISGKQYAECRSADCDYAECRGALKQD